ncbi:hypothetical protein [Geoalkalibacter halelectricus]|uniref:hypothetical protein n=1 Tax=Geoalkalibacter halelectricus TaxID=2847045 RepID=UPI003D256B3A
MNAALAYEEFDLEAIDPPRILCCQEIDDETIWATSMEWVEAHQRLIERISRRIVRWALCEEDLIQQAHFLAFKTLKRVLKSGCLDEFVGQFCKAYRKDLAKYTRGNLLHKLVFFPNIEDVLEPDHFTGDMFMESAEQYSAKTQLIALALECMTAQQAAIWKQILAGKGRICDLAREMVPNADPETFESKQKVLSALLARSYTKISERSLCDAARKQQRARAKIKVCHPSGKEVSITFCRLSATPAINTAKEHLGLYFQQSILPERRLA